MGFTLYELILKGLAFNSPARDILASGLGVVLVGVALATPLGWGANGHENGYGAIKEDMLRRLETKNRSLESKRRTLREKRLENEQKAQHMTSKIVTNQRKLDRAQQDLRYQQTRLIHTKTRLNYLAQDIDRTVGEQTRLNHAAARRLRDIYMGGRINMLHVILDSGNMSTFLDRLYYKRRMVAQDKQLLTDLKRKTVELKHQQDQLAQQQVYIGQTIQNIEGLKTSIYGRLSYDKKLRERYWKDARYYEIAENQLLEESQRIGYEIRRLTAKSGKGQTVATSTGIFTWPVIGRITSNFGYRVHPIHRMRKMHTGLDIAKPHGEVVKAADGGQVIYVGWRGGYGKVVMINHGFRNGKNLVSLYGHLSSYSVQNGQTVQKGQAVARVGSTGYSTGPHLHFEIRENGQPVNPMNYL